MAVSSTSTVDEPKWGIYAGQDIPKHGRIGYGEVAIHTFNMMANSFVVDEDTGHTLEDLSEVVEFVEQFIWVPQSTGGQFEADELTRIVTAIPGVGVLGGYNPKLTNADWNQSLAYNRPYWGEEAGLTHPGRGASSPYFEAALSATSEIVAGTEIFMNYGENWQKDDEEESAEISKDDFKKIDETIEKMIAFFAKHEADLDPESKQQIYQFLIQDIMAAAAGTKKGKKIAEMLPETPDDLPRVIELGGSMKLSSPGAVRSIEWLSRHGRCIDNIKPAPSTIPNAGRGAFATRPLAKDTPIAPLPLLQIPDERILEMFPVEVRTDEEDQEYYSRTLGEGPNDMQLLYNYIFGHPDSTMVFLPAGSATSFINHSPEPNAKLIWSNHPNNHKHWFDLAPDSLIDAGNGHLGLLMEVVATRDIEEGEEVTINYGSEWEEAWKKHLEEYEALKASGEIPASWPIRALDMNAEYATKPYEVEANYPENVMLKCFLVVRKPKDGPHTNEAGDLLREWTDTGKTLMSDNLFSCEVSEREEVTNEDGTTEWYYTIRWENSKSVAWVKKVPHRALTFMDRPDTSDMHFEYAFRHYIGIPDEIFPQGPWRNVGVVEEEDEYEEEE